MLTILEVLENAQENINSGHIFQLDMGKQQLRNAILLLCAGCEANDDFDGVLLADILAELDEGENQNE